MNNSYANDRLGDNSINQKDPRLSMHNDSFPPSNYAPSGYPGGFGGNQPSYDPYSRRIETP